MGAGSMPRARHRAEMSRFMLPVSGITVGLVQPTGADEVLLAEGRVEDPALAVALAERLGQTDPQIDWAALTVTDIDTLIVRLRQALVGNRVVAEAVCGAAGCGERVDLSFGIDVWLAHHLPAPGLPKGRAWRTEPMAEAPGWYSLLVGGAPEAGFRLPTLADQIAADASPDAAAAMTERCIRPANLGHRWLAWVETAMERLAPALAGPLVGRCPHCSTPITALFQARQYCLRELRDRARFVYEDIDALAERYHWSERAILTLPGPRRMQYVERIRQVRVA